MQDQAKQQATRPGPAVRPGPVAFRVGEEIGLRRGRFRIVAVGQRFMRLEGLPGTRITQQGPLTK